VPLARAREAGGRYRKRWWERERERDYLQVKHFHYSITFISFGKLGELFFHVRRRAPMIRLIRPTTPRRLVQSSHQVRQFPRPLQRRLCSSCAHGSRRVGAGLQHATPLPFAAQSRPLWYSSYMCARMSETGAGKGSLWVGGNDTPRTRETPRSTHTILHSTVSVIFHFQRVPRLHSVARCCCS
jgi:hypothetical protein